MASGQRSSSEDKKPGSIAELAYGLLYADITNGRMAPGQKLLPAELSEKYSVGLSPLRDALNRLCANGLAVKREQKGFFVADIDEAEFLKITDARLVVEEAALRLSIAKGDQRWEDSVVLAFHRLAKVATVGGKFVLTPEWSTSHQEFHFSLIAACDNEWLLSFCHKLYEQTTRYRAPPAPFPPRARCRYSAISSRRTATSWSAAWPAMRMVPPTCWSITTERPSSW